jgi:hypothetical protein
MCELNIMYQNHYKILWCYTVQADCSWLGHQLIYHCCLYLFISNISMSLVHSFHRNQSISRKGAYIISRRVSHGQFAHRCCPQAFLRIFSEVTYIRTLGNSSLLKIYTLPNHTITIGVYILETQLLGLLYGGGASFVQKWSMPWISPNI